MAAGVALAACGDSEGRPTGESAAADAPQSAISTPPSPGAAVEEASTATPQQGGEPVAAPSAGSEELASGRPADGEPAGPQPAPAAETPPPAGAPDAVSILRRAERAYESIRSLEAEFVQDLTVPLLDTTQRSRGKIYHRQPDRFLMKFSDPQGDVVVADGRHLWLYYPSNDPKQVVRTSIGEKGRQVDLQREFLSNADERFDSTLHGTESVAGREAWLLTLVPRQASPYQRVRVWVDKQDALVRRFEVLEQNETLRRLELRNLKPNATLPDALFRFTPPPGAQVFDQ